MRTKSVHVLIATAICGVVACSASTASDDGGGGAQAMSAGRSALGGSTGSVAGAAMGGSAIGGSAIGGSGTGGSAIGGAATGIGGSGTGGSGTSGSGTGGAATGGATTGGAGRGGTGSGGSGPGGAGRGGNGSGGSATAGMGGMTGSSGSTGNCMATPPSGGTAHCSSNAQGSVNDLRWTVWSSGNGGCLTTYGTGAAFKATWNNSGDFLARVGLQWDETKTYDQYGTVSADFVSSKTGTAGGYSYIGIYGWSNNPLIEYYIVDDWFGGGGPPTAGGTLKGSFMVDGGTYKIYTHTQVNQGSIHGNATFPQFFSIRQTARQCGHISITEHYKQWASLGMTLGKMYEAKILVEAGGGVGSVDFTSASISAK